jgi:hypothetical protein
MRGQHWVVPKVGTVVDVTHNPSHPTLRAVCSACERPITYVSSVFGYRRATWRHLREAVN